MQSDQISRFYLLNFQSENTFLYYHKRYFQDQKNISDNLLSISSHVACNEQMLVTALFKIFFFSILLDLTAKIKMLKIRNFTYLIVILVVVYIKNNCKYEGL